MFLTADNTVCELGPDCKSSDLPTLILQLHYMPSINTKSNGMFWHLSCSKVRFAHKMWFVFGRGSSYFVEIILVCVVSWANMCIFIVHNVQVRLRSRGHSMGSFTLFYVLLFKMWTTKHGSIAREMHVWRDSTTVGRIYITVDIFATRRLLTWCHFNSQINPDKLSFWLTNKCWPLNMIQSGCDSRLCQWPSSAVTLNPATK